MFASCGDVGDVGAVATTWVVGFVGFGERIDVVDGSCLALDVFLNVFGAIPNHFDARLAVFVQEAHVFELKTLVDDANDNAFAGERGVEIISCVHAVDSCDLTCLFEKRAQTL